jgi:hypothetical protein
VGEKGLYKVMIEHIESTMFNQVHPREFHDLPDLRLIFSVVALGFAFLAHGFGIVGAFHPHRQTVSQKACAVSADRDIFLLDLFDIQIPKGKGNFLSMVMLPAVEGYKFH